MACPHFHNAHAFHIENHKLVEYLEKLARSLGVEVIDGTMTQAETGAVQIAGREAQGLRAINSRPGKRSPRTFLSTRRAFARSCWGARSGSRTRTLAARFLRPRSDRRLAPHRRADPALHRGRDDGRGLGWQIEHEHWINRGYVYSSRFHL